MTTTNVTLVECNRGQSERIVDGPTHVHFEAPVVTRTRLIKAAFAVGLVVVLVVAILIVIASIQPPRPMNSHPGDAQPPPVGYLVIGPTIGGTNHSYRTPPTWPRG
jgi:hypothetical protein